MTIVSLKYSVLVSLSFLESIDNPFVPRNNWVFFFFTQPQVVVFEIATLLKNIDIDMEKLISISISIR